MICIFCNGTGTAQNSPVPGLDGKRCQPCSGTGKVDIMPVPYYKAHESPTVAVKKRDFLKEEPRESCSCGVCAKACEIRPGWFLPGEAEKVAEFLEISFKTLFDERLTVDFYLDVNDDDNKPLRDAYVLSPALKGHVWAGGMAPYEYKGTCTFLDGSKCSIHDVKPFECRAYQHDDTAETVHERHKQIAKAWDNETAKAQLIELTEDMLYIPDRPSGFSLWF